MTEADGLAHELELGWPVFATNDAKEGPRRSPRSASDLHRDLIVSPDV